MRRINEVVAGGNEGFQRITDGPKDRANRLNNWIEVARDVVDAVKQGINFQIKPDDSS